jgi:uncharacterized repeat protein (TIGR02543 family)
MLRRSITALLLSAAFVASLISGSTSTTPASAAGATIGLYLSPPLVQGSDVTGADAILESFDSYSVGTCPSSIATGTLTTNLSTACSILAVSDVTGASTTTSAPTFGGSGSNAPATGWYNPGQPLRSITFDFTNPVRYVGFWWSGGSPGNNVEFINDGAVIASFDLTALASVVGSTPPVSWPAGNGYVTSTDSTQYAKGLYFGNPRAFSSLTPSSPSTMVPTAQYVYFNLYMPGTMTLDALRVSGPGFEFDNLVTSTVSQTPPGTFVLADSIAVSNLVTFMPNGTGVTGTTAAQASASTATLTPNGFSRPGYSFAGWNTAELGNGDAYTNEQSYDFSADLTLYAQWTEDPASTFTVTFEPNGGSGTATTQDGAGTVALDANTFSRDGFTFTGWNTQEDGEGEWFSDNADYTFSADQTLWAQWTAVTPPTPDAPSIDGLVNTGLAILGPFGVTGVLLAFGAPFFFVSDRFRRMRAFGSVILHKSDHLTVTTPARFFDRLRRKK